MRFTIAALPILRAAVGMVGCLGMATPGWCASEGREVRAVGGQLQPKLASYVEYSSNIESRKGGSPDLLFAVEPSLSYRSVASSVAFELSGSVTFLQYLELGQNDAADKRLAVNLSYPHAVDLPYTINFNAEHYEETSGDNEFGRVVRDRLFTAYIEGQYTPNRMFSMTSSYRYKKTDPVDGRRFQTSSSAYLFSIDYVYSDLLRYGLAYRFREEESGADVPVLNRDHALFLRARGLLSPLVRADIGTGLQYRRFKTGDGDIAPFASGSLTWNYSSAVDIILSLSADFDTTTGAQSSRRYEVELGVLRSLAFNLQGQLSGSYAVEEFSDEIDNGLDDGREDSEWILGASVLTARRTNANWRVGMAYRGHRSDLEFANFTELSMRLTYEYEF